MSTRAPLLVVAALVLCSVLGTASGITLGLGGGPAGSLEEGFTLGVLEFIAETNASGWLSPRFTIAYLPPLLPAERPVALLGGGIRAALGSTVRPLIALGAGALVEAGRFGGMDLALAWIATAGCELRIFPSTGVYATGSLILANREHPHGTTLDAYFPWSVGLFVTMPTATGSP